jgi:hypothetical protein
MKKEIDCYRVNIELVLRKEWWDESNDGKMTKENVHDRIQQGVEIPIEDISIKIEK